MREDSECPDCLQRSGLCATCRRVILPQLAVNVGWLKLMGNAEVEQRSRQSRHDEYVDRAAVEKAKRREARKARRAALLRTTLAA